MDSGLFISYFLTDGAFHLYYIIMKKLDFKRVSRNKTKTHVLIFSSICIVFAEIGITSGIKLIILKGRQRFTSVRPFLLLPLLQQHIFLA